MNRRMIDSAMWQNSNFAQLPMGARLLQIGLINHADDQGRIKADLMQLKIQIFPCDDFALSQIQEWLEMMAANETIILYAVNGKQYAQLINWWKYQSLQYAQPSQYPRPEGWKDRIRKTLTKGFIATCNWQTVDGARLPDTCDMDGNPGKPNIDSGNSTLPPYRPFTPSPNGHSPEPLPTTPTDSPVDSGECPPDDSPEYPPGRSVAIQEEEKRREENKAATRAHACEGEPEKPLAAAPPDGEKRKAFVREYEKTWALLLTPYLAEKLDDWCARVPIEAWEFALHECAENRKVGNWKYFETILRRVEAEGVPKTPEKIPKQQQATVSGQVNINFAEV